jgi:hypothetical protein
MSYNVPGKLKGYEGGRFLFSAALIPSPLGRSRHSRERGCVIIAKNIVLLFVMPNLIRHPAV